MGTSPYATSRPAIGPSLLAGGLFVLAVLPLARSLELAPLGLGVALWLLLFVLGFLLSMSEAAAFRDGPSPVGLREVIGALIAAGVVASFAAVVLDTEAPGSLAGNLARWVNGIGPGRVVLRILGASVAFMVAYCLIGSIAWRFVRPYYTDPALGLRLRVPSGRVVILLQLGRGLVATLALTPLIASTTARGVDGWSRFALALAVTQGVVPLLLAREWPVRLRVVHAIEIVLFGAVYAFALWRLFGA